MEKERTIKVLNSLITINNDRIEGYETASDVTEEFELKNLFEQFISTSRKCKEELVLEVHTLGGEESEGTKTTGKFFRVWMDLKAALTAKDRKAILNSCEFGESMAEETYNTAIMNGFKLLNHDQKTMINMQKLLLKSDHDHLKELRNAVVNV